MKTIFKSAALCAFLAGCSGGNPFIDIDGNPTDPTNDGTGITRDGVPPGTDNPSPGGPIFRTEIPTPDGNGFAQSISYNSEDDTFFVDNLGFDGANVYRRSSAPRSLAGYNVYEADRLYPDSVTGEPIRQFTHRAIYGVSRNTDGNGNPNTQFAIVRTGAYVPYGFGGFIYQRNVGVNLPETGQAIFRGTSAGLRDFNDAISDGVVPGGLQYTTADVAVAIDFEDFNNVGNARGDAVQGQFTNRRVFDIFGNDITQETLDRLSDATGVVQTRIPGAVFSVGPGVLDGNGDLVGEISSTINTASGPQAYEAGSYYAIVSGTDPDEIVGVMVVESDTEFDIQTRETSGFIVYRDPDLQP